MTLLPLSAVVRLTRIAVLGVVSGAYGLWRVHFPNRAFSRHPLASRAASTALAMSPVIAALAGDVRRRPRFARL